MATQYVTIKKSQPAFLDFLWGHIENNTKYPANRDQRAIPVKTYNLGTPEESITFELKALSEIKKPGFFVFVSALIKLNSFILILFPLFYTLEKNYLSQGLLNPLSKLFASLASVFLFAGLNIRNDVNDHISGYDRVNIDLNNKPIRMGWLSASRASKISFVLILCSVVLASLSTLLQPRLVWIIGLAGLLFLLAQFNKRNSYKQQHSGELTLYLLIGPALATGYQVATGSAIDREILFFGLLWGFAVLYLIQINNFSHIMTSSQSGIKNTMTKLGFDWSQKFLIAAWIFFIGIHTLFHLHYSQLRWTIINFLVMVSVSAPTLLKIFNIKSPMGSGLQRIRKEAYRNFLVVVFLFLTEILWYQWTTSI